MVIIMSSTSLFHSKENVSSLFHSKENVSATHKYYGGRGGGSVPPFIIHGPTWNFNRFFFYTYNNDIEVVNNNNN